MIWRERCGFSRNLKANAASCSPGAGFWNYLAGDLPGAVQELQHARKQNPDVQGFITGRKKLPKSRPDFYSLGDITEAIACMDVIGAAWAKHREAVQWLKKEHGSEYLFTKGPGKK
jgi:hypothetical protein